MAIDLITEHIKMKLQQPELRRLYHNLEVMPSNYQIRGMHTLIRDRTTSKADFVFYADRLLRLVRAPCPAPPRPALPCHALLRAFPGTSQRRHRAAGGARGGTKAPSSAWLCFECAAQRPHLGRPLQAKSSAE